MAKISASHSQLLERMCSGRQVSLVFLTGAGMSVPTDEVRAVGVQHSFLGWQIS